MATPLAAPGARDKRTVWREQEQKLVESWTAAAERYRAIHEELSTHPQAGGAEIEAELRGKAQAALADIEALRRKVARLKREFLSGKRY